MTQTSLVLFGFLVFAGCQRDETLTAYDTSAGAFTLQSIDGTPFSARVTIDISEPGKLSGDGPCNRYFASQNVPYPWFEAGPIGATRMACPDLALETSYFTALSEMEFAELLGNTLLLTNEAGREMLFQASP